MKLLAYILSIPFIPACLLYWFSVWDVFGILLMMGMLGIALLGFFRSFRKPELASKRVSDTE